MITIGYCTRVQNDEHTKHLIKTCGLDAKKIQIIEIVNKGDRSLTECYNEILEKSLYEHVVFCHSDIIIETKQWGTKLLKLFEKNNDFGIIGVAGTKEIPSSGKWWENPKKMYGKVAHTHEGKSWLTSYSNDLNQDLEEVVVLDGVFFAVNKQRIKNKFNENVKGFHFYDVTFCIENYLSGVKLGVTTLLRINHKSIGMTNDEWEQNRLIFSENFKDKLPLSIKKTLRRKERLNIMMTSLSFDDISPKSKIMFELATKLKKLKHNITICSNINGKLPKIAHQNGITMAPIQQPPGFIIGDGKWTLNTQNGPIVSQPNTLYKVRDFKYDIIHVFDDELVDHMNKLYGGTTLINTRNPNALFVNTETNPLVSTTIELSNDINDINKINIDDIVEKYSDNL